ncbi:hypothetical protein CDD83_1051 [Cordyceps sp. RAO-2017]|nr:hypothetical protein CDD83_1051 [Cordyceps sp. RAO-2017]
MAKPAGRASKFRDPDETVAKDYDPEGDAPPSDRGSDDGSSEEEDAGTEHYLSVGKSRLRQREGVSLGPDYRGSRISRSALQAAGDSEEEEEEEEGSGETGSDDESEGSSEYDDPETADLAADEAQANDSDIDSDNAFAESDVERFDGFTFRGSSTAAKATEKPAKKKSAKPTKRATAADYMSSSDEEEDYGGADLSDDEESGAELHDSEDEGSSEEDEGEASDDAEGIGEDDESEEEVEKGMAIQQQRNIYDGLLNLRIRLQKALVAANTFPTMEEDGSTAESEPYEAAEEAAIKLLNTISSLRDNFAASHQIGDKRKRELSTSMPNEAIWDCLQEQDMQTDEFRKDRLERWSRKVRSVNVMALKSLGQRNYSLVDSLEKQLGDLEGRLVKRTRVPRSCAPVQAARKVLVDENVYDDGDFYQLLLKELVDQRMVETSAGTASAVPTVMLTAGKESKMRKQVDRKASKGRKMRFTVHEKLQNLMAPEDRRTWEQGAIDRLFGTLFGRKMQLDEEESEEEAMEDAEAEEEGLRLFRNNV